MLTASRNRQSRRLDLSAPKRTPGQLKKPKPKVEQVAKTTKPEPVKAPVAKTDRRQKLTEQDVKAILADRNSDSPSTISELALQYGVKVPTITHILYGITWKSIPR